MWVHLVSLWCMYNIQQMVQTRQLKIAQTEAETLKY